MSNKVGNTLIKDKAVNFKTSSNVVLMLEYLAKKLQLSKSGTIEYLIRREIDFLERKEAEQSK